MKLISWFKEKFKKYKKSVQAELIQQRVLDVPKVEVTTKEPIPIKEKTRKFSITPQQNVNTTTADAIRDLYSGNKLVSFMEWNPVILTNSATGFDSEYLLPIIPIDSDCILIFINGVRSQFYEFIESRNVIKFNGPIPEGYNVSAFVLGRLI